VSSCAARPRLGWNRRPLPMGGGCVDSRGGGESERNGERGGGIGTAVAVAISIRASVGGNQLLFFFEKGLDPIYLVHPGFYRKHPGEDKKYNKLHSIQTPGV